MSVDNLIALAEARKARRRGGGDGGGRTPGGAEGTDDRPIIRIEPGETKRIVDEADAALAAKGEGLYRQSGRIVRIIWDKIKVAGDGEGQVLRLSMASEPHIRERLETAARWEKYDGRAEGFVTTGCPKDIAAAFLARDGDWSLPYLLGVVMSPTLRPDGSVIDQPGYDEPTGLVYDPAGWEFPAAIPEPTRADAEAALEVLKEPIRDFPFVSGAARSVALSGMMTAVLRRAMPTAPLHAFTAPAAGTGKSMLVDIAAIMATGEKAAVTTTGRDKYGDAELEKRLVSSLLASDAVLSIDNLEGPLGNETLCSMLTQTRMKLRPLGSSNQIDVPVTTSYFATSNNLVVLGDMTRRVLAGALDAGVERPELRPFSWNPMDYVRENRGSLVNAVLTIARAWLRSGEAARESPLGSFERWSKLVRDPLVWLGEADPVDVMEEIRKGDPRIARLKGLLETWYAVFRNEPKTVAEALEVANERGPDGGDYRNGDFRAALAAASAGGDSGPLNPEKVGWFLRKNLNRVLGGAKFVRDEDYTRKTRYMVFGSIENRSKPESVDEIPF